MDEPGRRAKIDENFRIGERWAMVGVIGNLALTAFKYLCGILGRSSAMIADATHSASDILASGAVYLSMKIAKKPDDDEHPFGHGGAEVVATVIVALLLFAAGGLILASAVKALVTGEYGEPRFIAFVAAVTSIAVKEAMYRLTMRAGRRIGSPALMADAKHHRSDVYSSIGTVVGIGGALLGLPILDPIAAAVVSLFIFRMAWSVTRTSVDQIMGATCSSEVRANIAAVAAAVDGVCMVHHVRAMQSGPYIRADITIHVERTLTVEQGHDIADAVSDALLDNVPHMYDVVVHVEPEELT